MKCYLNLLKKFNVDLLKYKIFSSKNIPNKYISIMYHIKMLKEISKKFYILV